MEELKSGWLTDDRNPGTVESAAKTREWLGSEAELLEGVLYERSLEMTLDLISREKEGENIELLSERTWGILHLGDGVLRVSNSVVNARDRTDIDSGYVLARALVERAVNFAFLCTCSDEDYATWTSHSKQKAYRLLNRRQKAGLLEVVFSTNLNVGSRPPIRLLQDLNRFTSKHGREITRWTDQSLGDLLYAVDGKFESSRRVVLFLLLGLTQAFEIGAEAQHGTLLGVGLQKGLFAMPNETLVSQADILLLVAGAALHSTVQTLAHTSDHPHWAEQSDTNLETLREALRVLRKPIE